MDTCINCRTKLIPSLKYYCCNIKELSCISCRKNICKKCGEKRSHLFIPITCYQCRKSSNENPQNNMYYQHLCDIYYCAKCLIKTQPKNNKRKLPCNHQCTQQQFQIYIRDFCRICGSPYKNSLDYELKDRNKICCKCFVKQKLFIHNQMIKCLSCDVTIRSYSDKNLSKNSSQQMMICVDCYNQQSNSPLYQPEKQINIQEQKQQLKEQKQSPPTSPKDHKNIKGHKKKDIPSLKKVGKSILNNKPFFSSIQNAQIEIQISKNKIKDQPGIIVVQTKQLITQPTNFQDNKIKENLIEQAKNQNDEQVDILMLNFPLDVQLKHQQNNEVSCKICQYILQKQYALFISQEKCYLCKLCCLNKKLPSLISNFQIRRQQVKLANSRNRHSSNNKYLQNNKEDQLTKSSFKKYNAFNEDYSNKNFLMKKLNINSPARLLNYQYKISRNQIQQKVCSKCFKIIGQQTYIIFNKLCNTCYLQK